MQAIYALAKKRRTKYDPKNIYNFNASLSVVQKLLIVFLIMSVLPAGAQDIHFSQYYANPLYMNPALTGSFFGTFRMTALYRNQAFTISNNPYVTFSGSFDMAPLKKKMRYDVFGVGLLLYNDKAGDGALTTTSAQVSAAYAKTLDAFKKYSIGIGIQGGIINKRIDFSKLTFESQWNGDDGFDNSISSGENPAGNSIIMPDITIGVVWKAYFNKNINTYAGGSWGHIIQPRQSFLNDANSRLSRRYVVHAATDFRIGKQLALTPALMFKAQNTAQQFNVGAAFSYDLSDFTSLYFGAWYRVKDAVIPMLAFEIFGFRAGLSYDANISKLRPASRGHGAVELSLIYIHKKAAPSYFAPSNFCPRM
jgi:type IX secretion system PorP/SprF family membrane protein